MTPEERLQPSPAPAHSLPDPAGTSAPGFAPRTAPGWYLPFLLACVAMVALQTLPALHAPGLNYDEVLFANAALGAHEPAFVEFAVPLGRHRVPLMLMPYIGPVKAALFAPIFSVFPPTPWAVRIPPILIGMSVVLMTAAAARRLFGVSAAAISAALLATDPAFLQHIRLDYGPVAIMMGLKLGVLACLLIALGTGARGPLLAAAGMAGLGVLDKVNFAWFLGSLGIALLVAFPRQLRHLCRWPNWALAGLISALACWPLIAYNLATGGGSLHRHPWLAPGPQTHVLAKLSTLWATAEGGLLPRHVNAQPLGSWENWISDGVFGLVRLLPDREVSLVPWLLAVGIAAAFIRLLLPQGSLKRPTAFVLITFAGIVACILATPAATGSHHMMMVWPFPHLLVGAMAAPLVHRIGSGPRRPGARPIRLAAVFLGIAVMATSLEVNAKTLASFAATGGRRAWSDAISDLAAYAEQNPGTTFVLLDWGINNQLLLLSRGAILREYLAWPLMAGGDEEGMERIRRLAQRPDHLFVYRPEEMATFSRPLSLYRRVSAEPGVKAQPLESFRQRDGNLVLVVERLQLDSPALLPPG